MIRPHPDDDDLDADAEAELEEFEARLEVVLRERALRTARVPGPPTPHEAQQLAAMAAHARAQRRDTTGPTEAAPPREASPGPARAPRRRGARGLLPIAAAAAAVAAVLGARLGGHGDRPTPPRPDPGQVYLGGSDPGPDHAAAHFPGAVSWDLRGRDGVVQLQVFDLAGGRRTLVFEAQVEGNSWRPAQRMPALFEVVVDRPGDDGFEREVLFHEKFLGP